MSTYSQNYFEDDSLFNAVRDNDAELVEHLLKQGADPNTKDDRGNTPLFHVIFAMLTLNQEISAKMAELLLQYGADPNIKGSYGYSPLYRAVALGNTPVIKILLKYGADPNTKNDYNTPLYRAMIQGGFPKIVKTLLQHGADVNARSDHGNTVLVIAVCHKNTEAVRFLLQYGINPNIKNMLGRSPIDYIDYADCLKSSEICELLIRHGAKTTKESNFLYLVGASPNYRDKDTLVSDLGELLDSGYLNLNPPDPELQEIIAERLTPGLRVISDSSDLSMTVSSLILRTLSVFSPFLIG